MFCEGAELGTAKEVLKKTLPKGQMPYPENGQAAAIGNRVLDEIGSIKLGLRDPDMAEVESLAKQFRDAKTADGEPHFLQYGRSRSRETRSECEDRFFAGQGTSRSQRISPAPFEESPCRVHRRSL